VPPFGDNRLSKSARQANIRLPSIITASYCKYPLYRRGFNRPIYQIRYMNFYQQIKLAAFLDQVQTLEKSPGYLKLNISGKIYEYFGTDVERMYDTIDKLKRMKNKKLAGEKLSQIINGLKPYLYVPEQNQQIS
jgi:hypothetical protein